jgi:hypothetical protein
MKLVTLVSVVTFNLASMFFPNFANANFNTDSCRGVNQLSASLETNILLKDKMKELEKFNSYKKIRYNSQDTYTVCSLNQKTNTLVYVMITDNTKIVAGNDQYNVVIKYYTLSDPIAKGVKLTTFNILKNKNPLEFYRIKKLLKNSK